MLVIPRLVAEYRTRDVPYFGSGQVIVDPSGPVPRLLVRTGEALVVHELPGGGGDVADPVAVFPGPTTGPVVGYRPVAYDLSHAVLTDEGRYQMVTREGVRLWELPMPRVDSRPVMSATWCRSPRGEPQVWLVVAVDPERDGQVDPSRAVSLALLDTRGAEIERMVVPLVGENQGVLPILGSDGKVVAISNCGSVRPVTFTLGHDGRTVSLLSERKLLSYSAARSLLVTVGLDDSGRRTDVRWHDARNGTTVSELSLAEILSSEPDDGPSHVDPYISWDGGGLMDDESLLVMLEDEDPYEEGGDDWRGMSHWSVTRGAGCHHIKYPIPLRDSQLYDSYPLGDGTWLMGGRQELYRWSLR
ncbi:hypothetical protein [Actinomadura sp. 9N407]|uniref:hypothetical protein n=1 Tax=Actinomadura sp. 9N407 TaxID=3375154 RepID=UPI0037B9A21F